MSRSPRALFALLALLSTLLLAGLMGASLPVSSLSNTNQITTFVENTTAPVLPPPPSPPTTASPELTSLLRIPPLPTVTPEPSPTLARREFLEVSPYPKVAPTSFLPGRGPVIPGQLIFTGRRLDVYVGRGTFSADEAAELGVKGERALNYIQQRFAVELSQRVSVGVYGRAAAPDAGTRGIAYTQNQNVRIFYRPGEDLHNALVILSHELAHQLQAEAYGSEAQSRADIVLLEGLATWISGEYWLSLSGASSFTERSRQLYAQGYRGNLAGLTRSANSVVAYEMWAGFVEYLTNTYGWDSFNRLYASGRGRAAGSADYVGIYGKPFAELATEYQATLR